MAREKKPGVYGILCLENQKWYIGSSEDVHRRIAEHRNQLRRNEHYQLPRLQADWNIYGQNAFSFVNFDHESKSIRQLENELIEQLETLEHQRGYNKMLGGQWGIEARIRNVEAKLVRYGHFKRLPSIPAESPMTESYITTMVL